MKSEITEGAPAGCFRPEIGKLWPEYDDGRLDGEERKAELFGFLEHVSICGPCNDRHRAELRSEVLVPMVEEWAKQEGVSFEEMEQRLKTKAFRDSVPPGSRGLPC